MREALPVGDKIDLIGLVKIFWAKRWLFLGAAFLVTLIIMVFAFFYRPTYLSQAEVGMAGFTNPIRILIHAEGALYRDFYEPHESDIVKILMVAIEDPSSEYYLDRFNDPQRFRQYLESEAISAEYSERSPDFRIFLGPVEMIQTPSGKWLRTERLLVETESETAVRAEEGLSLVGAYLKTELLHAAWSMVANHLERQYIQIGDIIEAKIIHVLENRKGLEKDLAALDAFESGAEKNLPPEWDALKKLSMRYFLPIQQQKRGLQLMLANQELQVDGLRQIKVGLERLREYLAAGYPPDPEKALALGPALPDRVKQSGENLRLFALSLGSGLGMLELRTIRSRSLRNALVIAVSLFFLLISFFIVFYSFGKKMEAVLPNQTISSSGPPTVFAEAGYRSVGIDSSGIINDR